jgi:hypothetical protein
MNTFHEINVRISVANVQMLNFKDQESFEGHVMNHLANDFGHEVLKYFPECVEVRDELDSDVRVYGMRVAVGLPRDIAGYVRSEREEAYTDGYHAGWRKATREVWSKLKDRFMDLAKEL